jgi:hypothetical protein
MKILSAFLRCYLWADTDRVKLIGAFLQLVVSNAPEKTSGVL